MTKPYLYKKTLPKLRAEQKRLERLLTSNLPEAATKYIKTACQKISRAVTILEKEAKHDKA